MRPNAKTWVFSAWGLLLVCLLALPALACQSTTVQKPAKAVAGEARVNAKDDLEYVWLPAGTFQMGCVPGDGECEGNEKPRHGVTLSRGFWMGKTEVTVGAYRRMPVPTYPPPTYPQGGPDHPAVYVSWDEAKTFCEWSGGRLPTEAEWEYGARGGREGLKYPWGDAISHEDANYGGTSGRDRWGGTSPVGSFAANGFGLHDMSGNVAEWVGDWYHGSYYGISPGVDPKGPAAGGWRVLRDGSSYISSGLLHASYRGYFVPSFRYDSVGFRCVRDGLP